MQNKLQEEILGKLQAHLTGLYLQKQAVEDEIVEVKRAIECISGARGSDLEELIR